MGNYYLDDRPTDTLEEAALILAVDRTHGLSSYFYCSYCGMDGVRGQNALSIAHKPVCPVGTVARLLPERYLELIALRAEWLRNQ